MTMSNERSFRLAVCDVDETLLVDDTLKPGQRGNELALARLRQGLEAHPSICFGVATGRSLALLEDVMRRYPFFPQLRFAVTNVGSELHWNEGGRFMRDEAFQSHITENWNREQVAHALSRVPLLVQQEPAKQTDTKVSFYAAEGFHLTLAQEALVGIPCTVLFSHGQYLDVLPQRASKSQAIRFVAKRLGILNRDIVVAGDSGNDRDMLARFKGILVGNHAQEVADLRDYPEVFAASEAYAGGVLQGLRHYGFLPMA